MKNVYEKLLKIKKPIIIEVRNSRWNDLSRYRILYPNGKCEYIRIHSSESFHKSCFTEKSLKSTVLEMKNYDDMFGLILTKIKEI